VLLSTAAKLIVDEGFSAEHALAQAATTSGLQLHQCRPSPEELREAVREYRALFRPEQFAELAAHHQAALEAMRSLAPFHPRLFGSLVDGTGPLDQISVLLQAESAEVVIHELEDRHIPWRSDEKILHHTSGEQQAHPALRFEAGRSSVELVILARHFRSDPPCNPIDHKPLETLTTDALAAHLAALEPANCTSRSLTDAFDP
jgi:hypothetical protein